jgi:hypothetical protein
MTKKKVHDLKNITKKLASTTKGTDVSHLSVSGFTIP